MRNGTYFLNNSGTRIVHYVNGKKEKVQLIVDGVFVGMRTILYQEAFGNFGLFAISYKSKIYKLFPDKDENGEIFVKIKTNN